MKKGFTLIELLVVVLIIGILAAVAVPQYQFAVDKSRVAPYLEQIKSIIKAQQLYYLENGEFAADMNSLSITAFHQCTALGCFEYRNCPFGISINLPTSGENGCHLLGTTIELSYCSNGSANCRLETHKDMALMFSLTTGKVSSCNSLSSSRGKKLCTWIRSQFN